MSLTSSEQFEQSTEHGRTTVCVEQTDERSTSQPGALGKLESIPPVGEIDNIMKACAVTAEGEFIPENGTTRDVASVKAPEVEDAEVSEASLGTASKVVVNAPGAPTKKPRGRPRKVRPINPEPKKPRGRPRKAATTSPEISIGGRPVYYQEMEDDMFADLDNAKITANMIVSPTRMSPLCLPGTLSGGVHKSLRTSTHSTAAPSSSRASSKRQTLLSQPRVSNGSMASPISSPVATLELHQTQTSQLHVSNALVSSSSSSQAMTRSVPRSSDSSSSRPTSSRKTDQTVPVSGENMAPAESVDQSLLKKGATLKRQKPASKSKAAKKQKTTINIESDSMTNSDDEGLENDDEQSQTEKDDHHSIVGAATAVIENFRAAGQQMVPFEQQSEEQNAYNVAEMERAEAQEDMDITMRAYDNLDEDDLIGLERVDMPQMNVDTVGAATYSAPEVGMGYKNFLLTLPALKPASRQTYKTFPGTNQGKKQLGEAVFRSLYRLNCCLPLRKRIVYHF